MNTDIGIREYVETSTEATKRTRTFVFVLMIVSVLMFSSFINSVQGNWKLQRVRVLRDVDSPSVRSILGPLPPKDSGEYEIYKEHYKQLYSMTLRQYLDSVYTIQIPLFGVSIDLNDVGPLGGLALVITLFLFRLSLTREFDNLCLSFEAARAQSQLTNFYYLLAMRQVLIIPLIKGKTRSKFLSVTTKLICVIPFVIYLLFVMNDLLMLRDGQALSAIGYAVYIFLDPIFLLAISILTFMCYQRWKRLDSMWDFYWNLMINEGQKKR